MRSKTPEPDRRPSTFQAQASPPFTHPDLPTLEASSRQTPTSSTSQPSLRLH